MCIRDRFVGNLKQQDFIVAESGQPRPILDFHAQSDGPVKLALLFDISGSMRVGSKAVDAVQTARVLLSALKAGDEAACRSAAPSCCSRTASTRAAASRRSR